jgi:tRNA 2-(methylsulfanyl)-N6-isopentenyladenosine37 hydroxylase
MLGLSAVTPEEWVQKALADLDTFLIDHAHCEMKAATNAMALIARYPDEMDLVQALTDLAQEELEHFRQVVALLAQRGLKLGKPQEDSYASLLRSASQRLPKRHESRFVLIDRLLVGALIEARSCERFRLLSVALLAQARTEDDRKLAHFYDELMRCEAKHYRTYIDLAKLGAREFAYEVEPRLKMLAGAESAIVQNQAESPQATVHG